MSKQGFKHIFLMGSSRLKGVPETLVALTQHLAKHTVSLTIEQSTATLFDSSGFSTANTSHLPEEIDLIVVIGGDGSMINAAHTALAYQIPVLGINRGRLGFLTDISPDSLDSITEILAGDHDTEQRFFLEEPDLAPLEFASAQPEVWFPFVCPVRKKKWWQHSDSDEWFWAQKL